MREPQKPPSLPSPKGGKEQHATLAMNWTTPADLRAQVQKLWDKGLLLKPTDSANDQFPLRLRFTAPSSTELTARFDEVRAWMTGLAAGAQRLRIVQRGWRHAILGNNSVPSEAWVDTPADALALIGKQKEALRFAALVVLTQNQQPELLPWLAKRPLQALALADAWPRLLSVVAWLQAHPRPGIYLRQVDVAGVDSKFIELHRSVLAELFDLALPPDAMDHTATGASGFCRRYGFLDKPLRIRFRWLDTLDARYGQDISITQTAFEQLGACRPWGVESDLQPTIPKSDRLLAPPMHRVFITENEVNFLAFPPVANAMVVFGGGFGGLDRLRAADWLNQCQLHYWGDIDTHGFAMLDQLRAYFPNAQSLLMDQRTLLAHAEHWGHEGLAQQRDLPRLTADERAVYDSLRDNRIRPGLRLEQERIGFGWVYQALAAL